MRKILSVAPLLLAIPFVSHAQAQRPAAPGPALAPSVAAFLEQFDEAGTGSVSREQFLAFRQQRYAQTDENRDGAVDEDEYVNEYLARLGQSRAESGDGEGASGLQFNMGYAANDA